MNDVVLAHRWYGCSVVAERCLWMPFGPKRCLVKTRSANKPAIIMQTPTEQTSTSIEHQLVAQSDLYICVSKLCEKIWDVGLVCGLSMRLGSGESSQEWQSSEGLLLLYRNLVWVLDYLRRNWIKTIKPSIHELDELLQHRYTCHVVKKFNDILHNNFGITVNCWAIVKLERSRDTMILGF